MRILITNSTLDLRTGTDLYVRDLAIGLQRRGHELVACATRLGDVANELRRATVPVIDDPSKCPWRPDVIHGHHHVDTMAALCAFPGVPAVSVCHGWLPWEEMPPITPRVGRYVAVDQTCRDRLVLECGIDERKVEVLLNFVDLHRFIPRDALPIKPSRALIFSNLTRDDQSVAAIRDACARAGLGLDLMGLASGTASTRPEHVLGRYDIVFAKARAALEAMAVGVAVVVADQGRLGEMVTTASFERLRALNFGIRALDRPVHADLLTAEIARYDAADAAAVSARVRAEAGLDAAVERWIALYERVRAEAEPVETADEMRALAAYLCAIAPRLRDYYVQIHQNQNLATELGRSRQAAQVLSDRLRAMQPPAI